MPYYKYNCYIRMRLSKIFLEIIGIYTYSIIGLVLFFRYRNGQLVNYCNFAIKIIMF